MRVSEEHERLVRMLKESISLMCKSSLSYEVELNIEGLLGITLDKKDIFLVNINESFHTGKKVETVNEALSPQRQRSFARKRGSEDIIEIKEEDESLSLSKKRHVRRRSRESASESMSGVASPSLTSPGRPGHSKASASQLQPDYIGRTGGSREESVTLSGAIDTQSSGLSSSDSNLKMESGNLDFSDIVIKQEVDQTGDDSGQDAVGEFSFTGERFQGHPPYPTSLPHSTGGGAGDTSQVNRHPPRGH